MALKRVVDKTKNTYLNDRFEDEDLNKYTEDDALSLIAWFRFTSSPQELSNANLDSPLTLTYEGDIPTSSFTNQEIGEATYPAVKFDNLSNHNASVSSSKFSFSARPNGYPGQLAKDLPFTISLWVKPNDTSQGKWLFGKQNQASNESEYYAHISSHRIEFAVTDFERANTLHVRTHAYVLEDSLQDKWNHIVFTYEGAPPPGESADAQRALKIYVNGKVQETPDNFSAGSYSGMDPWHNGPLKIGANYDGNNEFNGEMAEFAIWSKKLSESSIRAIYNTAKSRFTRNNQFSGFLNHSPRIQSIDNLNRHDSYSSFDDTRTIDFIDPRQESVIKINRVPYDAHTITLTHHSTKNGTVGKVFEFQKGVILSFNNNTTPTTAGGFIAGKKYKIVSVDDGQSGEVTDFTLIGAPNNSLNTVFVATGPGTGTGTARAENVEVNIRDCKTPSQVARKLVNAINSETVHGRWSFHAEQIKPNEIKITKGLIDVLSNVSNITTSSSERFVEVTKKFTAKAQPTAAYPSLEITRSEHLINRKNHGLASKSDIEIVRPITKQTVPLPIDYEPTIKPFNEGDAHASFGFEEGIEGISPERDQNSEFYVSGSLSVISPASIKSRKRIVIDAPVVENTDLKFSSETDGNPAVIAGNFVVGTRYRIVSVNNGPGGANTDFTLIGASDSEPGTVFVAKTVNPEDDPSLGVGTGTGTAIPVTMSPMAYYNKNLSKWEPIGTLQGSFLDQTTSNNPKEQLNTALDRSMIGFTPSHGITAWSTADTEITVDNQGVSSIPKNHNGFNDYRTTTSNFRFFPPERLAFASSVGMFEDGGPQYPKILSVGSISSPTNVFGFPSHPKYHATGSQEIVMSEYITKPFVLEKIVYEFNVGHHVGKADSHLTSAASIKTLDSTSGNQPLSTEIDLSTVTFFLLNQRTAAVGSELDSVPMFDVSDSDSYGAHLDGEVAPIGNRPPRGSLVTLDNSIGSIPRTVQLSSENIISAADIVKGKTYIVYARGTSNFPGSNIVGSIFVANQSSLSGTGKVIEVGSSDLSVATIRDLVSWNRLTHSPHNFDSDYLDAGAKDVRKESDLVINTGNNKRLFGDSLGNTKKYSIAGSCVAPVVQISNVTGSASHAGSACVARMSESTTGNVKRGVYFGIDTDGNIESTTPTSQDISLSKRSIGRSLAGINSGRSVQSENPSSSPLYSFRGLKDSELMVTAYEKDNQDSPYVLLPGDKLILGCQSPINQELTSLDHPLITLGSCKGKIILYGYELESGRETNKEYSRDSKGNSSFLTECVGSIESRDQFETHPRMTYFKSSIDEVVSGDMYLNIVGDDFLRLPAALKLKQRGVAGRNSEGTQGETGSLLRGRKLTDNSERYYDSMIPDITNLMNADGVRGADITVSSGVVTDFQAPGVILGVKGSDETYKSHMSITDAEYKVIWDNWFASYPFEPRYQAISRERLTSTRRVMNIDSQTGSGLGSSTDNPLDYVALALFEEAGSDKITITGTELAGSHDSNSSLTSNSTAYKTNSTNIVANALVPGGRSSNLLINHPPINSSEVYLAWNHDDEGDNDSRWGDGDNKREPGNASPDAYSSVTFTCDAETGGVNNADDGENLAFSLGGVDYDAEFDSNSSTSSSDVIGGDATVGQPVDAIQLSKDVRSHITLNLDTLDGTNVKQRRLFSIGKPISYPTGTNIASNIKAKLAMFVPVTFAMWIRPSSEFYDSNVGVHNIFSVEGQYGLYMENTGRLVFTVQTISVTRNQQFSSSYYAYSDLANGENILSENPKQWVHIAVRIDPASSADDVNNGDGDTVNHENRRSNTTVTFFKNGVKWGNSQTINSSTFGYTVEGGNNYDFTGDVVAPLTLGAVDSEFTSLLNRFDGMVSNFLMFKADGLASDFVNAHIRTAPDHTDAALVDGDILKIYEKDGGGSTHGTGDAGQVYDYANTDVSLGHPHEHDLVAYFKLDKIESDPSTGNNFVTNHSREGVHLDVVGSAVVLITAPGPDGASFELLRVPDAPPTTALAESLKRSLDAAFSTQISDGRVIVEQKDEVVTLQAKNSFHILGPSPVFHGGLTQKFDQATTVAAGSFDHTTGGGVRYKIKTVNTPDWSGWGGPNPAIPGDVFVATAVGSGGAGDAYPEETGGEAPITVSEWTGRDLIKVKGGIFKKRAVLDSIANNTDSTLETVHFAALQAKDLGRSLVSFEDTGVPDKYYNLGTSLASDTDFFQRVFFGSGNGPCKSPKYNLSEPANSTVETTVTTVPLVTHPAVGDAATVLGTNLLNDTLHPDGSSGLIGVGTSAQTTQVGTHDEGEALQLADKYIDFSGPTQRELYITREVQAGETVYIRYAAFSIGSGAAGGHPRGLTSNGDAYERADSSDNGVQVEIKSADGQSYSPVHNHFVCKIDNVEVDPQSSFLFAPSGGQTYTDRFEAGSGENNSPLTTDTDLLPRIHGVSGDPDVQQADNTYPLFEFTATFNCFIRLRQPYWTSYVSYLDHWIFRYLEFAFKSTDPNATPITSRGNFSQTAIADQIQLRGAKYGLVSPVSLKTSAVFSAGSFGNCRDMLEQRRFTRTFNGTTVSEAPVQVQFQERRSKRIIGPEETNSSNLDQFCTSSLPYFDGATRDRSSNQPDLVEKIEVDIQV